MDKICLNKWSRTCWVTLYLICSFFYKYEVTLLPNKKDFGQFGGGLSRFVATHIASKVQYLPSTFFKDYKSPIKVLKLAHFFQFPVVRVANWVVAEKLNYKYLVYIVRNLAATKRISLHLQSLFASRFPKWSSAAI